MTPQSNASTLVNYTYHEEKQVHEYIFADGSRQTVDEWYRLLHHAYRTASETQPPALRILVDVSVASQPPLAYAFQKAKALIKDYPSAPPRRVAFMGTTSMLAILLKPFIRLLRSDLTFNYFDPDAKVEAFAWLSEE